MTDHGSESENPVIPPHRQAGRPRSNQDWWPNQLNLQVLTSTRRGPTRMGEDFDYAEEFRPSTSTR